jgi:RNA polymerase sigma-70 factor, ECF subfamily
MRQNVARLESGDYDVQHLPRLPRHEFNHEYVERLIAEDPEVERHFAGYFTDLLTLKLRSRLRSKALVDDAIQETFTRVLTTLKSGGLQSAERLGAFVNSVCNNVLFEVYRAGSRTTPLEDDYDQADNRGPSAEARVVQAEDHARVREVLAELPQREQDVLRWLFFEDRDKDEVCSTLAVDRSYLRVLVHRAKMRFRERLLERTG